MQRSLIAVCVIAILTISLALPALATQHFSFHNPTSFSIWVTFYEAGSGKNAKTLCLRPDSEATWSRGNGGNFIKSLLGEARKNNNCQNSGRIWYLRDNNVRSSGDINKTVKEHSNGGLSW